MRVISVKPLKAFWESGYADSEQPLKAWYKIFKQNNFANPNEIKLLFSSASFINNNRIVFNISGNKYRLVVRIKYDKINAKEV